MMDLMETMNFLAFARNIMGLTEFQEAFKGTEIEEHLWRQYSAMYHHDLLAFFRYLDKDERLMLTAYLKRPEFIDRYTKQL